MYPVLQPNDKCYITGMEEYEKEYNYSISNNEQYWRDKANQHLHWMKEFDTTKSGDLKNGNVQWFVNGKLNVSVNCIDRHVENGNGQKIAIIWESDEPGEGCAYTYQQVLEETCKVANMMKHFGVKKGDTVAIYMPMIPQIAFTMLACTRIGAIHSVVFAGFSANALRDRILDAKSKFVFTADQGKRGGRTLELKKIVDDAVKDVDFVKNVFVFPRTRNEQVDWNDTIDVDMEKEMEKQSSTCDPEVMDSESPMFILYTSGSTGSPKVLFYGK